MASTRWFIAGVTLFALVACDDSNFDNPCDPANLDKGGCMTQTTDGATPEVDMASPDMASPDMASPDMAIDMAPPTLDMRVPEPDMRVPDPDMRVPDPDMRLLDMAPPDMGAAPPTDSVCTDGESSADCVVGDCTQTRCMPGPVCDPESGHCLPPAAGDCLLSGCLNAAYCGANGHCIERCETAGCPSGRRCDLNTSRCIPAGEACENHRFNPACERNNITEGMCVEAGGQWGVWVDRGDSECKCPAPDAGCPCRGHGDCAGNCIVPADAERVCRAGIRGRCERANFPEVCQCSAGLDEDGRQIADGPATACPP